MRRWVFIPLLGLLLAGVAWAAVTPNSIVTMQTATRGIVQFLQGADTAGTYKTIYTAGANGSKCNGLWSTNDDAAVTHPLTVQLTNAGVRYGGVTVMTTSSQGFASGVPALNLLAPTLWPGLPLDSDGNPYLLMVSGDTLQAKYELNLSTSTRISIVASCGEY